MAQKRMFNKAITNDDNFLEMPMSSQVLYFHLSMNADDDGFVNNWKSIMRMTGTKDDDLKVLIAKQYIIPFESGVIVIKHWRLNNYLQKDRIIPTQYQEELKQLQVNKNNVYEMYTKCIHSIDKNSIVENSIDNNRFKKPTLEEVKEYCLERKNNIDPETFINFYESKGWFVGKNKMKDWKACIRTWEKNKKPKKEEKLPTWFNQDQELQELSEEEKRMIDEVLDL
jgi:hypothetical protein